MSISQTNVIAKIAAVVAGLGLVAMSFASFAVPAKAQSADLSAQIAALQAQLAALMAQAGASGSASASTTFTRDLTMGSTGADVTALQNWLISKGYSIPAGATGYFGAQTKAAVAAWQAAAGITPAAGYFGPKSRAAAGAGAGAGAGTGNSTAGLTGGAGKLQSVELVGDVESDLEEGDDATRVLGFEAEADDSDLAVQRLDVKFTIANSGGSASLAKYVDTISVYQGDKKLASMDASDGDKDGRVWTFRFADLNGVIREGDTEQFYIVVEPVSSIGSDETGDSISVEFTTDGIRAIDAQGVSETYTPTSNAAESFTVSTATNGTLTISEASDNPKATTIKADLTDTTEDVTLASFNLKAKNQDIVVHDLPVGIVANAAALNDIVQTVKLMSGSKVLKSKTITSTGDDQQVIFDNIDQEIEQDETQNFTVVATIRKIDSSGSTFNSGDYIYATTSAAVNNAFDVEDEDGNSITPSGSHTGNNISFEATGISVAKTDASYTKTVGQNSGEGDNTQYSISFKVTAGDEDLYIGRSITRLTSPSTVPSGNASGVNWATTTSSTASTTHPTIATNLSASDTNSGDVAGSYYKIPSGTSRTFTLNVTLTSGGPAGYTGVQLVGINYSTTTTIGAVYYKSGLDTFKTADVLMTVH